MCLSELGGFGPALVYGLFHHHPKLLLLELLDLSLFGFDSDCQTSNLSPHPIIPMEGHLAKAGVLSIRQERPSEARPQGLRQGGEPA